MNTHVQGDPGSCHVAAGTLRRVAVRTAEGGDLARDGVRTPERSFSGVTADAYRGSCANVLVTTDGLERRSQDAAAALDSYGADLAAVQRVMDRVRASARSHALLSGWALVLPDAPTPAQEEAHRRLATIAEDAATYLERARSRLVDAFTPDLSIPVPPDYGTVLVPPDPPAVGPLAFPPPDSAWPGSTSGTGAGQPPAEEDPVPGHEPHRGPHREPPGERPVHVPPDGHSPDGPSPGVLGVRPPRQEPDVRRTPPSPGDTAQAHLPGPVVLPGEGLLP